MTEETPASVQPVATQSVRSKSKASARVSEQLAHDDVLGFASGSIVQIEGVAVYVRDRLPQHDGTADFDSLARVKEDLRSFAATGGNDRSSVGGLAQSALSYLAGAEQAIERLPEEHRELARTILRCGWHAGRHEATARLRVRGTKYANKGKKSDADLEAARKNIEPWHPGDLDLFRQIEQFMSLHQHAGKKPSASSAIKKLLYPRLQGTPLKAWPSQERLSFDALRNRFARHSRKS